MAELRSFPGIRAKPIPVYRSTRCHQRRVQMQAAMAVVTDTEEEMQRRWLDLIGRLRWRARD